MHQSAWDGAAVPWDMCGTGRPHVHQGACEQCWQCCAPERMPALLWCAAGGFEAKAAAAAARAAGQRVAVGVPVRPAAAAAPSASAGAAKAVASEPAPFLLLLRLKAYAL